MGGTTQAQIPSGVDQAISTIFAFSLSVFESAENPHYHAWARGLRNHYLSESFQQRFAIDLGDARESVRDGEAFVDMEGAEATTDADDLGTGPIPYVLLLREFAAYVQTQAAPGAVHEDIDHGLDVGDILLGSLQAFLQGHPISAAVISLIREMGKIARAINKKLSQ